MMLMHFSGFYSVGLVPCLGHALIILGIAHLAHLLHHHHAIVAGCRFHRGTRRVEAIAPLVTEGMGTSIRITRLDTQQIITVVEDLWLVHKIIGHTDFRTIAVATVEGIVG